MFSARTKQLALMLFALYFGSLVSFSVLSANMPALQLATKYPAKQPATKAISDYWISEKLDGIRGYWNGEKLVTRKGNVIHAPLWFIKGWPKTTLEGELWLARNTFEQVASCVLSQTEKPCWQSIKFMLFDLPDNTSTFTERIKTMSTIVSQTKSPYLAVIKQIKLNSKTELENYLSEVVMKGGEGLMLHYQHAYYQQGRSQNIMKLKKHQDAEAQVLAHTKGKSKYQGMLGALVVQTAQGIRFKIGTGFSDEERKSPPPIGAVITYKYLGKTQKGTPKFASFLRVKPAVLIK